MIHKNITLNTSNKNKINEFKRFGLTFQVSEGFDLKEVDSDINNVILYKAIDAGNNILVEDTVLEINGEEIVDIRWKIKEISEMDSTTTVNFITSLAIVDDGFVYIYRGQVKCKLIENAINLSVPDDAFGFDPYLIPEGSNYSFYELEKEGKKDLFSPRKIAVNLLNQGSYLSKVKVSQVKKWDGKYQNQ